MISTDFYSICGERVSSYEATVSIPRKARVLKKEEMKIVNAIPFYPATTSISRIAKEARQTPSMCLLVINSVSICEQFLICSDGKKISRLKGDLSNVD
ncbi:hypothetical protein [uncultured Sphaerochaeta sp.]|uniref:hypothetical protein n=1 Tax=uncultured Sphaerochaeta sp. TaxID=886478 RepID=UPI002A0A1302|nr:hypothetical protein [uncultured Sphaerochaeta sp.]